MGTQILSRADSLLEDLCCTDVQYQMPAGQCKPVISLQFRGGQSWSLWDMVKFPAEKLHQALRMLALIESRWESSSHKDVELDESMLEGGMGACNDIIEISNSIG